MASMAPEDGGEDRAMEAIIGGIMMMGSPLKIVGFDDGVGRSSNAVAVVWVLRELNLGHS